MADDTADSPMDSGAPQPSLSPGGQPPVAAGGAGAPPTGNLPPTGGGMSAPAAKLGLQVRAKAMVTGGVQMLKMAYALDPNTELGRDIHSALGKLHKHVAQDDQGGNMDPMLMKLLQSKMGGGGGAPGAGGPGALPQPPTGPVPSVTAGQST